MLRNTENVIRQLENPNGGNEPVPAPDEPVEEEMTPVIEARYVLYNLIYVVTCCNL